MREIKAANAQAKQGRDRYFAEGTQWDGRQDYIERHPYGNEQGHKGRERPGDASIHPRVRNATRKSVRRADGT